MKQILSFLVLVAVATALYAEPPALTPERFLPAAVRDAADAEWLDGFARELIHLSTGVPYSGAALKRAAEFCSTAEFPATYKLAAAMTALTIRDTDYRLRAGAPTAAVQALAASGWNRMLVATEAVKAKKDKNRAADELSQDLSLAGGTDQSLPQDKEKKDKKIDDLIKEKKAKKEK